MPKSLVPTCVTLLLLSNTIYSEGNTFLGAVELFLNVFTVLLLFFVLPELVNNFKTIKPFFLSVSLFYVIAIVNSYINGMSSGMRFGTILMLRSWIFILLMCKYLKSNPIFIFKTLTISVLLLSSINLCFVIVADNQFLIAGNRNGFPVLFMPGLLAGFLYSKVSPIGKIYLYVLLAIALSSVVIVGSATSFVGIFVILLYTILENRIKFIKKYGAILLFVLIISFFLLIIVLKNSILISTTTFIAGFFDVLGKDLTFSGRIYVWADAIKIIRDNFFSGVGLYWQEGLFDVKVAHNIFLDIMLVGGAILMGYVVLTVSLLMKKVKHNSNRDIFGGVTFIFMCYLLMLQFEVYTYVSICMFLFIIYASSFINKRSIGL